MNKVGICFSTKDRTELSEQSIVSLLQPDKFDLWIVDGSTTEEGKRWPYEVHKGHSPVKVIENIRGGADAAIVHNLTFLLSKRYEYIGLVENDVLLDPDWFEHTMAAFTGSSDPRRVGAASARCYEDRILATYTVNDRFAFMHNLGAGMVIFTRRAAQLVLHNFRTTFTLENRQTFGQLAGIDIARWWAFKGGEHWLCADWGFDKVLAQHGYASLACLPNRCRMIGQNLSLNAQGLTYATAPPPERVAPDLLERYAGSLRRIAAGDVLVTLRGMRHVNQHGGTLVFAHQLAILGGTYSQPNHWKLKWAQGFGPFGWESVSDDATITVPAFGSCEVFLGGASSQATAAHGFTAVVPAAGPTQIGALSVPAGLNTYDLKLSMPKGAIFYGVQTRMPQPYVVSDPFDYYVLPEAG